MKRKINFSGKKAMFIWFIYSFLHTRWDFFFLLQKCPYMKKINLYDGYTWIMMTDYQFSSVQLLSTSDCLWPHELQHARSLLKLMSIGLMIPPKHLILCRPLLLVPSIFPSIRAFSNEPILRIRWPKYWSFSFSINPSDEYLGLISFRIYWLDLLVVQGTLKTFLKHYCFLKASILRRSAFFMVQLSHPYMITGKP